MTTALSWLDGDIGQRRRMVEMLDALGDKGALDELGLGTIRDTFADALFPATSTQHSAIRYLLFVPWMFRYIAQDSSLRTRAMCDTRSMRGVRAEVNVRLVEALRRSGTAGARGSGRRIIGSDAGARLKQLPSGIYWTALAALQIATGADPSPEALLSRVIHVASATSRRTPDPDDTAPVSDGLSWNLPAPPTDFLSDDSILSFDLTPSEADFLAEHFLLARPVQATAVLDQSMTSWLILRRGCDTADAGSAWDPAWSGVVPDDLRRVLTHARDFNLLARGAGLQYNAILTEALGVGDDSDARRAHAELDQWRQEVQVPGTLWDRDHDHEDFADFLVLLEELNPRIRPAALRFVTDWLEVVRTGAVDSTRARELIEHRETRLKGSRARLTHSAAREVHAGLVDIDYSFRWPVVRRHLNDIRAGQERDRV